MYATAVVFALVVTKPSERLLQKYKDIKNEYRGYWSE